MKKNREGPPIDDLFARKLGNLSLPPKPDGFARLQVRMGQKEENRQVVFWRNPVVVRYMVAVACLLLVGIFGWLTWPVSEEVDGPEVATTTNSTQEQRRAEVPLTKGGLPTSRIEPSVVIRSRPNKENPVILNQQVAEKDRVAQRLKLVNVGKSKNGLPAGVTELDREAIIKSAPEPVIAQVKPDGDKSSSKPVTNLAVQPTVLLPPDQLALQPDKATRTNQRVLVMTIPEPDALVEARQAAQDTDEKIVVMQAKATKHTGMRKIVAQLQRVRGSETVAARDDDERGLLGRAYKGIKRSLEKDKSQRQ